MRVIRSVRRQANIGLSHQFQWRQIIRISSARLHPGGTNTQWHGRSYGASAPSTLESTKARGRVSKDERKSMVENYVNKYREMNAGKFPTVSNAQKDVGGSYYVVREIIQELKYNSKMPHLDTGVRTSLEKSAAGKDEVSYSLGEVSQAEEPGEILGAISNVDTLGCNSKSFESREESQSSASVEMSSKDEAQSFPALSEDVGTQSRHSTGEPRSYLHSHLENNTQQETVSEDKLKSSSLQSKGVQQELTESEAYESERELQKVPTEDAEPHRKSSVWENLKSFANGIFGLWRRS